MSNNIELRANTWYAVLIIPKDVRETLGKFKFFKTLKTTSKKEACRLALPLVALWKAQIEEARGNTGAVHNEALRWKGYLASAQGVVLDVLEEQLLDKAKELEVKHDLEHAEDFYQVATGKRTPLDTHYENWVAQISLVPKTKDQTVKDVETFLKQFKSIEKVTKLEVKRWIDGLQADGNSVGTANRMLISARNYWGYLRRIEAVSINDEPLSLKGLLPPAKKLSKKGYIPFEPASIVNLWRAALSSNDQSLADLIYIGAYTGARIEEICSLKLVNINIDSFKIVNSKTKAGVREIPIHSDLKETFKRLREESTDGYLLSGLTFNKYGDRSNNVGKRFGKLKTSLGYTGTHVFHSIRKTFVTLLENAGITEGVTADIVGHEKKTMTYGLYSGGNSLAIKKAAIEKVQYQFN
ncbi:tyrosine-type recombinase/integrase [Methylotenera sp. 1P/1]|uniref:tyrosine-type recombinase/integrase n=1 Tax=Methylotenera sp. 1P/1 TaxID=1131551 RepID=UPI00037BC1FB|nr:tyrosine-type recombinase/integrase [Methylotenera sp. 1P/1]